MSEQKKHIVILGAGYAGMLAALRLTHKAKDARITLINASDTFVERIRLHQVATNQPVKRRSIPGLLRGKTVDFVQGWVTGLDPQRREVVVQVQGKEQRIEYDYLVYALGSMVDKNAAPGVADHAYTLAPDGERSAPALRQTLGVLAPEGGRVVVAGGGLTAIEAATEIADTYPELQVSLVTAGRLGAHLSQKGQAHVREVFKRLNIAVHEFSPVGGVDAQAVVTTNGERIPFDVCLWAGGFTVPPLAREAGISVNNKGQISIDPYLRSLSHSHIYAVGDAAAFVEDPGAPIRMACATAEPMAAQAADNLAALLHGDEPLPMGFSYVFQCISLGRHDGLIQWVYTDDSPKESIITGRQAAIVKEFICRFAWWSVDMHRRWPQMYNWPGQVKPKAAAARRAGQIA